VAKKFIWKVSDLKIELEKFPADTLLQCQRFWQTRTLMQNNYLHLVFQEIWNHWGESMEEVKIYLKSMFLWEYFEIDWITLCKTKDTRNLNKEDFKKFVEDIKIWAWDNLEFTIPNPEDLKFNNLSNIYGY